jgi:virulence factor Mce-like protein
MNARRLAYGAFGAALVALVVILLSSGSEGYVVRAEFKDAGGLRKDSSVKIAGVPAGTVSSISVTKDDTAIATFTLDKNAAPIGAGASVEVRPTDLLGERYAQLNVGNLNQQQPSGTTIPASRTSTPVELDDVLNMFNADTRTRLRILVNEAGVALAGRGADFNHLLNVLPPNLQQAQQLLGQVASENRTLETLISQGDRIASVVNGRRDQLGHLIGVAEGALGTVAGKHQQLGATLQQAPGALAQLRAALDQVGSAADAITPAATNLVQAAGPLTSTLNGLPAFESSARATLATATRVAPDLVRLAGGAKKPVADLRPTAAKLQTIAKASQPILAELDQRGMKDTLWFVENWALGMKARDALGHFVGADTLVDPTTIESALAAFLNKPSASAKHRDHKPTHHAAPLAAAVPQVSAPVAAPRNPGVGGLVGNLVGTANKLVAPILGNLKGAVNGVTNAAAPVLNKVKSLVNLGGSSGSGSGSGPSQQQQDSTRSLLQYLLGK